MRVQANEPRAHRFVPSDLVRHHTAQLGLLNSGELIALAAVAVTGFALYLDYRTGAALVDDVVWYRPIGESGGRLVSYHQLFGWTQIVWLAAGLAVATLPQTRAGFRSSPTVLLSTLFALILVATVRGGGIDRTTAVDLGATLLPLIGMTAVLTGPFVRSPVRRLLVTVFVAECAVVVLLSFVKKVLEGRAGERLEAFAFGPAPELGLVLSAALLLALAMGGPTWLRVPITATIGGGLLLTQTRGAVLACVCGGIVLGLLLPSARVWVAGIAVALLLVFALTTSRSVTFTDASTAYRRENLAHHWELFKDHPLLGYGVNSAGTDAFRAAHSVLLEMANAAGLIAAILFALAWLVPVAARLKRRSVDLVAAVAIGTVAAVFVDWNTTGSAILIYNPPTNLMPLVLAIGLLEPPVIGRRFV